MVQGHTQTDCRGKGRWQTLRIGKRTMRSIRFPSASIAFSSSYNDRTANEQWASFKSEEPKLSRSCPFGREAGGPMLSVTGLNHFYYVRDFSDMRCKHSRVLSIIREQLHREPNDGDVFIVMSKGRRIVRMFTYDNPLHYGSDEGVEMAVAYHSVISTVKLHGMSCWKYLGEFFKKIFNGCRDFFSLTPANIGMAYAKYRANEYKASLLDLYRVQPIFIK